MQVQAFYDRHLPANKIDECTIIDKCDHGLTIHLTNRYFTPKREAAAEEKISFTTDVNPTGKLAALAGDQFIHIEQNVVKYNTRNVVKGGAVKWVDARLWHIEIFTDGDARYEPIPPVRFRVGDIVEAKATLMLVPIRQGQFKLMAVLRGLTLLDTTFAQVSSRLV